MPDLDSHLLTEGLTFLGRTFTKDIKLRRPFFHLKFNPNAVVESTVSFAVFLAPVTFHGLKRNDIGG